MTLLQSGNTSLSGGGRAKSAVSGHSFQSRSLHLSDVTSCEEAMCCMSCTLSGNGILQRKAMCIKFPLELGYRKLSHIKACF
jgi:hypothetical protein